MAAKMGWVQHSYVWVLWALGNADVGGPELCCASEQPLMEELDLSLSLEVLLTIL